MARSNGDNTARKKRAPAAGTLVGVRLQPDLLAALDAHRATLPDGPSRPEAIRAILEGSLRMMGKL